MSDDKEPDTKPKIGRKRKLEHEKLSKIIRFRVTQRAFKKYNTPSLSTSSPSPTPSNSEILRKVIEQLDDDALIYFLFLDDLDPIREKFRYDFRFMNIDKE